MAAAKRRETSTKSLLYFTIVFFQLIDFATRVFGVTFSAYLKARIIGLTYARWNIKVPLKGRVSYIVEGRPKFEFGVLHKRAQSFCYPVQISADYPSGKVGQGRLAKLW